MPKTDLETLVVSFEASITKFEKSMGRLVVSTQGGTGRSRKVVDDAMKAMEDRTGKAADTMNRNLSRVSRSGGEVGRSIQNTAFQVGDFFVQVASGTSAMRAAAQQLPQLLGGFGVWGAVAGAAVAALSSVIGSMDLFGNSANVNAKDLQTFNDAMKDSKVSADIANSGYDALIAKLGTLTKTTRDALAATLEKNIEDEQTALKAGSTTLVGQVETQWKKIIEVIGGTGEAAGMSRKAIYDLNQELKADPGNSETYTKLAEVFRDLASRSTGDTKDAFDKLAQSFTIAAGNAEALATKAERYKTVAALARGETVEGGKAIVDAGTDADTTSAKMDKLAASLDNVGLSFDRMSGKAQSGFGRLGEVFDKERKSGLFIPDRPDSQIPNLFKSVDQSGFQPFDEEAAKFVVQPDKKKKTGSGTKRTPEQRAENKTQDLKDEIAYNEQLAAAYGLGETAIRKITAAYDALKAARQAGLKEGTTAYDNFIKEQTAQNEVNLGLEHRLDLMKQGKALTESLMTDQEKQTKLLADYQEMLQAGAITQTYYERAVAKAKSSNDALKDAISGVGDAIQSGIQGATSFGDALAKIGLQLLTLAARGLFGEGPFGGIFNKLLGVAAGGILGTSIGSTGTATTPSSLLGTGYRRSFASGGMAGPGSFLVGENGPEILSTARRGYVTPAQATRRLISGGGSSSGPIEINVNGARGNQEIMQMVSAGVAQGVELSGKRVPQIQRNYNLRFA